MATATEAPAGVPHFRPPGGGESCNAGFGADPRGFFLGPYRELGPVFSCDLFGRRFIALGGVEANQFVWGNPGYFENASGNQFMREQYDETLLGLLDGPAHTKKRRRMNMGFKPSLIFAHTAEMSGVFFDEVNPLANTAIDLRRLCLRLIVAMTGPVLMQTRLPPGMDITMALFNKDVLKAGRLGKWRHLFYLRPQRLWRRQKIFRFLRRVLRDHKRRPPEADDILSLILAAHPASEPPLTDREIVFDLTQLFMAGSTTTSHLVLWTIIYCCSRPDWLAELRAELDAHWDPAGFTGMKTLPKLRATLLEVERLMPPSVVSGSRTTTSDVAFRGVPIPKGSRILHLQTLGHFLPENYEEPFAFRPERFLANDALPEKWVHGTYGGGVHFCLGQPLARILPPLIVANLLKTFDVDFQPMPSLRCRLDVSTTPVEAEVTVVLRPRGSRA
jgi:cytochrome P450